MGDRTKGWLIRALPPLTFILLVGSWLPVISFVLLVGILQTHWWQAPWGPDVSQMLLQVVLVLGVVYSLHYLLMAVLLARRRPPGPVHLRFAALVFNNVVMAVLNALFALWSWTALSHAPSAPLLWAVVGMVVIMVIGPIGLGLRQAWLESRASRRPLRTR